MNWTRSSEGRHPSSHSEDLFDYSLVRNGVGFVLRAGRRHKVLAIACFCIVVGLAFISLSVLPKRYQVQATVLAQRSALMGSLSNPTLNRDFDLPTRAAREVVLRRENLIALCKQTNFVKRYLASRSPAAIAREWVYSALGAPKRTEEELLKDLVDMLERRLWVMVNNDGVVTITFEFSDRTLTFNIVEAALQSFLEARHASEISMVGETVSILEGHAAGLQKQISDMVPVLEAREREQRRMSAPPRRRLVVSAPAVARDEEGARMQSVLENRRRALNDLEEFRQRRLEEMQAQLAQAETLYAPQHPAVQSLRQNAEVLSSPSPQIEGLREEIKKMERDLAGRTSAAASSGAGAGGGLASPLQLQDELADLAVRAGDDDPRTEYERNKLRLLFRQYSNVVDKLDSARVELDTAQAAFKHRYSIISPPQLPKRPVKPNPPLVLAGGVVAGLLFALFAATVADLASGRVIEGWQVEHHLGVTILAERDS